MNIIIIAILAFFYYWFDRKINFEKRKQKRVGFVAFIKAKDDEIIKSVIATIIILFALPHLAEGIIIWFNIDSGISLELVKILIGFLAGTLGTFIIDKTTSFSKRKINDNL